MALFFSWLQAATACSILIGISLAQTRALSVSYLLVQFIEVVLVINPPWFSLPNALITTNPKPLCQPRVANSIQAS